MPRSSARQPGFTLVELLLVMGLVAVLAGITSVNLFSPQTKANINSLTDRLAADIKSQQIKAMSGDSMSASAAQEHGVYIQTGTYTLFKGTAYSGADTDNIPIASEGGVTLSTTFPSTQVVFDKGSGEVIGFTNGSNTITLSGSGETKTITINRYGAVTVN
ncbi:MAG TPA: prepilin-type N-terminal cleavage/methylation domain-containing protein [Candidatus Saccharimonadales bacterium]|nr:prepilin-type N-terminal cleavage/methylation domain-containing protein [Candidatus Saccharimonadales bacterium]